MIPRVEPVITQVLEQGAAELVAARLGDHAHLAAGAGAVFGRVAARLDPEFLHVLETRLQPEWRSVFAIRVAWRRIDDRRALDAVVLDDVLLVGASGESDVLPGAVACVL